MLSLEEVNSALMGLCVCQRNVIPCERECWTRQHRDPWLHQALKSQQVVASSQFFCMHVQNSTCRAWLFFFFFVVHENLTSQNPDSLLVRTYSRSFFSPLVQYGRWERASFTNNTWMLLFNDSESLVSWRIFFFFFWRLLNTKNLEWNLLVVRRGFFFLLLLSFFG